MSITATKVKMTCVGKKQSQHWKENKVEHLIELQVPYDQNSIYYKMSGGTNIELRTVNGDAADMFQLQGEYMMTIEPAKEGD
jgi:hypothetical protein